MRNQYTECQKPKWVKLEFEMLTFYKLGLSTKLWWTLGRINSLEFGQIRHIKGTDPLCLLPACLLVVLLMVSGHQLYTTVLASAPHLKILRIHIASNHGRTCGEGSLLLELASTSSGSADLVRASTLPRASTQLWSSSTLHFGKGDFLSEAVFLVLFTDPLTLLHHLAKFKEKETDIQFFSFN